MQRMFDNLFLSYCRFCARLREILYEAPWSSFDLILASAIFWMGCYFLWMTESDLFARFGGVYRVMARFGDEVVWGAMFALAGCYALLVVLWLHRPPFLARLAARMVVAFCVLSLAINNLGNSPPPASAITYGVLSLAAIWSLWRTRSSGR